MLGHLMNKTENADLKRRFGEFVSREGKELYRELLDKQVTFFDLLVAFLLLNPPVSVLAYLKRQEYLFAIKNVEFFLNFRNFFCKNNGSIIQNQLNCDRPLSSGGARQPRIKSQNHKRPFLLFG